MSMSRAVTILLLLFTMFKAVNAQRTNDVLQAIVTDEDFEGIAAAYVKNFRTNDFVITDTSGLFSIHCLVTDSLIISALGYEIKKIYPGEAQNMRIQLTSVAFRLKQVNVYDFKSWEVFKREFARIEIPEQKVNVSGLPAGKISKKPTYLASNTFEEKPGPLHFIVHPISSIAYYFNDEEKQKRKVWALMNQDNRETVYRRIVQRDSIKKWTDINDEYLDDFIIYCNVHIIEKELDREYYYKEKILELYPVYMEQRNK